MKKIICVMLSVLLAMSLVACGEKNTQPESIDDIMQSDTDESATEDDSSEEKTTEEVTEEVTEKETEQEKTEKETQRNFQRIKGYCLD